MSAGGDVESEHTANLLGALSLVVHDRSLEAISEAIGQGDSAAAALSWLENFVDRPSVGLLHRVLGLTPSERCGLWTGSRRRAISSVEEERMAARRACI